MEDLVAKFLSEGGQIKKAAAVPTVVKAETGAERFFRINTQRPSGLKTVNPVTVRRLQKEAGK